MSTFLTGKELESKLTDIIWNAQKYVLIVSPFIKLDNHTRKVFDKVKIKSKIAVYIIFGKNEEYKYNSFNEDDLNYFKEFKNITILYNKDLHAKHYANESEGLITSLNLYGYSMVNNIEFGVYFTKTILNPIDRLFEETYNSTHKLVHNFSEVVFLKRPQYSSSFFGLKKDRVGSSIIYDITNDFFNNGNYHKPKYFNEFDLETETTVEKKYAVKPQREHLKEPKLKYGITKEKSIKVRFEKKQKIGYCIRTGEEIPFNPERPMSYNAYRTWALFENPDYPESYCHKTGKPSNGKTCMANPILNE
jgi:hypothetical protein